MHKIASNLLTQGQDSFSIKRKREIRISSIPLKSKLTILLDLFSKSLYQDPEIKPSEAKLIIFVLRFLYDFNLTDQEFWDLEDHHQKSFKKFLIDRFFKHEASKSKHYRAIYHDISVHSDNTSTFSGISRPTSTRNLSKVPAHYLNRPKPPKKTGMFDNLSFNKSNEIQVSQRNLQAYNDVDPMKRQNFHNNQMNQGYMNQQLSFRDQESTKMSNAPIHQMKKQSPAVFVSKWKSCRRGSIKIKVRETKPGILNYVEEGFFNDNLLMGRTDYQKNKSGKISFKISKFCIKNLLDNGMRMSLLQDYLRKRERLNLICKRKKKMHSKAKRNDEKTKKIFKKSMKKLFRRHKKNNKNKKSVRV